MSNANHKGILQPLKCCEMNRLGSRNSRTDSFLVLYFTAFYWSSNVKKGKNSTTIKIPTVKWISKKYHFDSAKHTGILKLVEYFQLKSTKINYWELRNMLHVMCMWQTLGGLAILYPQTAV